MNAREEILGRVRAALRTARLPAAAAPVDLPPPSLESASPAEWRARLLAELRALNVAVHDEPDAAAVRARVAALVAGKRVLAWPDAELPFDVGRALGGAAAIAARVDPGAPRSALAAAGIGVTGADVAIAETGTLALVSTPGHPRTASLLPPVHVAVVRGEAIVPTMRACLRRLGAAIPGASAVNFITGPSRTADIELELTLGVHGPGELIVILGP